jgi:predicted nucleic acid-binding protein
MSSTDVNAPYFDTSYIVRLYLEDAGFEQVRQFAARSPALSAAWHGQAEVVAALHRAFREGRFTHERYAIALDQFELESTSPGFVWLPLSPEVQARVQQVYRTTPATTFLRAADALHLACAAVHGHREVYSHDRHFLAAAPHFGLRGIDIHTPA